MNYETIIAKLESMRDQKNVEGMARFGINPKNNLGIPIYKLRPLAKEIGKNHELSLKLWESGIHDARLLAVFVEDPKNVTEDQMELWAKDFDSWDVCDQACTSLFDRTQFAWKKVYEWAKRDEEFVKRATFSIIAGLSVHDKKSPDEKFEKLFELIKRESTDERNYVKKAVNWALRNIGKRNLSLNKKAIKFAMDIKNIDSKSAKWIANDAIRELTSSKIQERIKKKNN
jgi:3-methyladenine DNA glycosylase AlkD